LKNGVFDYIVLSPMSMVETRWCFQNNQHMLWDSREIKTWPR